MRKTIGLLLIGIVFSSTLSGCGISSSVTPTLTPSNTTLESTYTPLPSTPTHIRSTPMLMPIPQGETIIVTSTEDSGPGTLRQAISDAEPGDNIIFDPDIFPPENPSTIFLKDHNEYTVLPIITQGNITIDASNAGVVLDGSNITDEWINALVVESDGNTIQGLQIINFNGYGIIVTSGSYNVIGGDRSIGTGPTGRGNLISMNKAGIELSNTGANNFVTGNLIGTDYSGTKDWGNIVNGIMIFGKMTNNTIGPNNVIANSGSAGILIVGSDIFYKGTVGLLPASTDTFGNTITQNSIYKNASGIRLNGGNASLAFPLIANIDINAGTVSGSACAHCIIEIFSTNGNQGEVYEGQTIANDTGTFTYEHGGSFMGQYLASTATDADGNTSEFSQYFPSFQEGNSNPITTLQTRQSNELEDNKIGGFINSLWELAPETFPKGELNADHILDLGVTRVRFSIEDEYDKVQWDKPENMIEPNHDEFITTLSDNGIRLTFNLTFWDKDYVAQGGEIVYPRFKSEEEIQRYLDFVRFIVRHFKDRVEYFDIWNEPDLENSIQWIEVKDYINLVKRTIPVIHQEYPEAKIVVGGVTYTRERSAYDYLMEILKSDEIMPLVDVISWGGMHKTTPEYDSERQYYYDYPSIVQEIKDTASAHGFKGEYDVDELNWSTWATPGYPWSYCTETQCAKYYSRGIIMNLGMGVKVAQFYVVPNVHPYITVDTIKNLSTIMAGTEPIGLPFEIQSDATYIKNYAFSLSNGDYLLATWNDGVATDFDPGMSATVKISGFGEWFATGVDSIYGYEQDLITSNENGNLVIHDFLLKDYPIFIRLSK